MHFWIDKRATFGGRSNFGLGYNRSIGMSGMSYQHRRMRSKSLVTPIRQFPPPSVPSSSHHAKSQHLHHQQRQRHVPPEGAVAASNAISLNSHHIPVVHSVYPELATNHVDSIEGITSERPLRRCFFVYLKCVLCISVLLIFLTVKLYEDNNQIGLIWLLTSFGSICLVLFLLCVTKRRAPSVTNPPSRVSPVRFSNTRVIHNHGLIIHDESPEPPPPYEAVRLNEKAFITKESPPPSYEKINSI